MSSIKNFPMKKISFLISILIVISLINVNSASARVEFIKADEGGIVEMRQGTYLEISAGSLQEDTFIFGHMWYWKRLGVIFFGFWPSGTAFSQEAKLHIPFDLLNENPDDVSFCNENGEEVDDYIDYENEELVLYIPDFSYYYYRRR